MPKSSADLLWSKASKRLASGGSTQSTPDVACENMKPHLRNNEWWGRFYVPTCEHHSLRTASSEPTTPLLMSPVMGDTFRRGRTQSCHASGFLLSVTTCPIQRPLVSWLMSHCLRARWHKSQQSLTKCPDSDDETSCIMSQPVGV